jgi:hypothetical protein
MEITESLVRTSCATAVDAHPPNMNPATTSTAPSVRQQIIEVRIVFLLRTEKHRGMEEVNPLASGRAVP